MKSARLKFVLLVTVVIVLTSGMIVVSTGSEYPCQNVTANGIENTGSIELADVYYHKPTSL